MISDEATESAAVRFLRCWWGFFYEFVLFIHMLSSERINCYLHGLFLRKIASRANAKALVPQNERWTLIEDVLSRVLEEHLAVNVCVDPRQSLAETRWVTLLFCGCESWTWKGKLFFFASFCLCFVVMQVSTRMAVTFGSETSMSTSHVYSESLISVVEVHLACIQYF